jgi:DnaK suppressor protein
MLKEGTLEYFKSLLIQRLEELLTEGTNTLTSMNQLNERLPDPSDRATIESEIGFTLKIRERERKLIRKIEEALEKIRNGTFGVCEHCEEEISEGRLKARPVTTLCIDCKKRQEEEEQIRGL